MIIMSFFSFFFFGKKGKNLFNTKRNYKAQGHKPKKEQPTNKKMKHQKTLKRIN